MTRTLLALVACSLAIVACDGDGAGDRRTAASDATASPTASAAHSEGPSGSASGGEEGDVAAAVRAVFDTYDADRSGRFTPSESDRFLSNTFSAADADANRQISAEEWRRFGFGLASVAAQNGRAEQYEAAKRDIFNQYDADRSGTMSWEEFRTGTASEFEKAHAGASDQLELTFEQYQQTASVRRLAAAAGRG